MINWNGKEAAALVALQRGIPVSESPFAELAAASGMTEAQVLAFAQGLLDSGDARRFGAVFDARRLGYRSALCAMQVPPADLARTVATVAAVPGVTHAYERGWPADLPPDSPGGPSSQEFLNDEMQRINRISNIQQGMSNDPMKCASEKSPSSSICAPRRGGTGGRGADGVVVSHSDIGHSLLDIGHYPSSTPEAHPFTPSRWPNLWFTLAAPAEGFTQILATLRAGCAPYTIDELPAIRRFKIDVVFDARTRDRDECVGDTRGEGVQGLRGSGKTSASLHLSEKPPFEKGWPKTGGLFPEAHPCTPAPLHPFTPSASGNAANIIRLLQGNLPLSARFFAPLAEQLGILESALIGQLREWQENGILRRIGLLLRHREIGFKANGMCCWDVPEEDALDAGRRIAAAPEVTHCYERPYTSRFPFRLYAMIHTSSWQDTQALYQRITRDASLPPGQLLLSLTEFKKTSMTFF